MIIIIIYKLRHCHLQLYFPHSAECVAVFFERKICKLCEHQEVTLKNTYKQKGIGFENSKVLICSWTGMTLIYFQELQQDHLLCSSGHCATFRP